MSWEEDLRRGGSGEELQLDYLLSSLTEVICGFQ